MYMSNRTQSQNIIFSFGDQQDTTKKSSFLITMNTNQAFQGNELIKGKEDHKKIIVDVCNNIFTFLKQYNEGKTQDGKKFMKLVPTNQSDVKEDIKVSSMLEVGDKNHRLHSHTMITLTHDKDMAYKIDLPKLRQYLKAKGIHHLDVKFVKDHTASIKQYVFKTYKSKSVIN